MATIAKSLILIIIFSLISKGFCDKCVLGNIEIGTTRSGAVIAGKPEWNVVVKNNCQCAQSLITVSCQGFQSSYPIDPKKLVKHVDKCITTGERPCPAVLL